MKALFTFASFFLFLTHGIAQCVSSFPYSEDFDGSSWVIPPNTTQNGSIPACWTRNPTANDFIWVAGPSAIVNNNTGPLADFSGSGKFAYTESAGFSTIPPVSTVLITPFIDLATATNPELEFYYYMFGFQVGNLIVQVSNGGAWNTLVIISGQQQTNNNSAWLKSTQSLSTYAGDTIRIRFVGTKTSFSSLSRIAIDEISVQPAPTCPAVSNIYTTNTTTNSTQIGWFVGSATSTSWEIEYGPFGFTPGSGTTITTSTNPTTITGLSGSTTYSFFVREVCSPTDKSAWVGPQTTTTGCSAALTLPYNESFENPNWVAYTSFSNQGSYANCWFPTSITSNFDYKWLVNPNVLFANNTGPSGDHTTGSGKYIATQGTSGTNLFTAIRSPQIDLSTGSNPELRFWYHMFGNDIDKLEVDILPVGTTTWTNLVTINGQQQSSSNAAWKQSIVSLSAWATQTVYIRFRGYRNAGGFTATKIAVDDLSITNGSACPAPSGLQVANVTSNSAQISFNTTTGAQYEIKYGITGFNPATQGTALVAGSSPQTISPLTANTTYDVYVRRLCTTDSSSFFGPQTFSTLCMVSAPYQENFDGAIWVTGSQTFPQTIGTIDDCWNRTDQTTYFWSSGPEQFPSTQTGPAVDHTTGSGKFVFTNAFTFTGSGTYTADFVSPLIDLSPLTTPELTFWYHMFGNQIGTLEVQVSNGGVWATVKTITGQQQSSKTAPWEEEIIDLSSYAYDTILVRFRATRANNAFNTDIAIDDFDIHEQPSCPKPDDLMVSTITSNSASLSWTTGGATNWMIKYGAPGFSSATGTYLAIGTNPYVLGGLSPNTQYEVWVRDSCSANDVSAWYGPVYFRTACSPLTAPYSENFDGSSFVAWDFTDQNGDIDNCSLRSDTTGYYWVVGPGQFSSFQTGPSADHTTGSGQYMYTRSAGATANQTNTVYLTPWVDISTLTNPEVRFWYHMYGQQIDKLEVRVRRIDGTQQIISTKTGQQQTNSASPWLQQIVDISAFAGDTVRLLFSGFKTGFGTRAEIAIDDIEIDNPLNCGAPTNLTTGTVTQSSIQVSWNSAISAAASVLEYGPVGFSPGSGTIVNNVSSPYTITGLTQNTAYDIYVRDSCAWGALSSQIGPATDTTLSCLPVTAQFTATPSGLSVSFDASASGGSPATYDWNFGDGNTGTGVNPSHTYATGGSYNVTLIVGNACGGADTLIQTINVCAPLLPSFTFSINNLSVSLDATATTGSNLQYGWLFGDGNNGTGISTSHTYAADGNYTISLIVTDGCGNVDTIQQNITVCDVLNPQVSYVLNGLTVDFSVTGAAGATNYNWNFGDGNTGSGANPSHTYAVAGTYNVTVVFTNLCATQVTVSQIVTLCTPPKASWKYTILSSGATGMNVQFDGTASIGASTYLWEFGDGATNNTSAIPVHTYVPAGLFWVVKLTVTNACGDSDVLQSSLASIGIEDFEQIGIKAFPNPADDALLLKVPEFIAVKDITLHNAAGALVWQQLDGFDSLITIPTSAFANGNYILKLNTDVGTATFQIVVRH